MVRGLLAQPRATVQVGWFKRAATGPDRGVMHQGPNGLPPNTIMAYLKDTGTQLAELRSAVATVSTEAVQTCNSDPL